MRKKIAIAMSGGVDSSVAAAMMLREGHEVFGVTMDLFDSVPPSPAPIEAKKVADFLGIKHYTIDLRYHFQKHVINPFIQSYLDGTTPIPCAYCNRHLKFEQIFKHAHEYGADYVITGHYCRLVKKPDGSVELHKGVDAKKDQSYFLFDVRQEQLQRSLFPLGDMTKEQVRKLALEYDLPVATKSESQEICFIPDGNYAAYLSASGASIPKPGDIVDREGNVLGRHQGIHKHTVGQRKGLGISAPRPLYVIKIDAENDRVIVGERESLNQSSLIASETNWISGASPTSPLRVDVKIRNQARLAAATVTHMQGADYQVDFDQPQQGVAPGQAAVFYEGDRLVGGGWISK